MDEKRIWAELLATQAFARVALINFVRATTRNPYQAEARRAGILEETKTHVKAQNLPGFEEGFSEEVKEMAEARLDQLIVNLGEEPLPTPYG